MQINLSVSQITPTEFSKSKIELSDQIEAFIYCTYNKYWY